MTSHNKRRREREKLHYYFYAILFGQSTYYDEIRVSVNNKLSITNKAHTYILYISLVLETRRMGKMEISTVNYVIFYKCDPIITRNIIIHKIFGRKEKKLAVNSKIIHTPRFIVISAIISIL